MTKYLVLSDADSILAKGLENKQNQYRTHRDSLTIIQIDTSGAINQNSIFLSNSIINNAKSVALSSDKTTAYILQSRGEFPDSMRYSTELDWKLPIGKTLVAVDISDISDLKVIDTINVGKSPTAVVLSPDGKSLALSVDEKHSEIIRITLEDNRFQYVFRHPHAVYSKKGNIRATDISWHPSGKYFSVTLEEDRTVAFYKFIETTYGIKLALLGAPIEVGRSPTKTEFTPDGKYCVVINRDTTKSELISIQFDKAGNHSIVSRQPTGISPKDFAISPNGMQIAVLNKEGSEFPPIMTRHHSPNAAVSLFELDESGQLITIKGEIERVDKNAQSIQFDKSGQKVITSSFQHQESNTGLIEFYKIDSNKPSFKTEAKIKMPQGTHFIIEL